MYLQPLISPLSDTGPDDPICLAADAMLGSLAQYLLLAGFDTIYRNDIEDSELKELAGEGRIVLTRDRQLHDSLSPDRRYYVGTTEPESQVKDVVDEFELTVNRQALFTRCTDCNVPLEEAEPERIKQQVPEQTRRWIDDYVECPACLTVYWKGSHHEDIVEKFEEWGLLSN